MADNNNKTPPQMPPPPTPPPAAADGEKKGGKKEKIKKPQKPKGPIRTEVVIPFIIVLVVTWAYFHFFFDRNLKSLLEYGGYQIVGAEVNIASLETSFSDASIRIQKVELTDSERPTHNVFSVGEIRFGMLWDALLRAKIVINEMAVEEIILGGKRNHTGKVKPPEPPSIDDGKPSLLETEGKKLKDKALNETEKRYNDNVMGDVAALLGGADAGEQLKKIEGTLESKVMLKKFETDLNAKKLAWDVRLKTLPQGKEVSALGDRLSKVKTKDFKTPQELQASLTEIDKVLKEADAKYKTIQSASTDLDADLKNLDAQFKAVEQQIKTDISDLKARFKIPKIDAASISKSLLRPYLDPYIKKIDHYKALAEKYLPPKFANKITGKASENDPDDVPIQPHPRAKGVVYEFPNKFSYPLFWIKRVLISSKFDASSTYKTEETGYKGNIAGQILDITSNQKITNKPTVLKIDGDFPSAGMKDFMTEVSLDNRPDDSIVKFLFGIGSYTVDHKTIVDSKDVKIAFDNAVGTIKSEGSLIGLKKLDFKLDNKYANLKFDVSSPNAQIDPILKEIFAGLPDVTINADGEGILPRIDFELQSNIGSELQKGFERQLAKKIEEAKAKLQAYIDEQVGKEKAKIEGELNKMKAQADTEVKKVQAQLEAQKKQAEDKINIAKKDGENKAKQQVQNEIKKKLSGKDGKKLEDALKKKLGL